MPSQQPVWLPSETVENLLQAAPDVNVQPQQAAQLISQAVARLPMLQQELNVLAEQRSQELLEAHRRVRTAARQTGVRYAVQPQLPPDVLGIYLLLPIIL